jgi:peptidyl-tRNA hydrolase ICT1
VNTKTDIRIAIQQVNWIPSFVKLKLIEQNQGRLNTKGEFIVTSERYRSQLSNRKDCIDKLYQLILDASHLPGKPSQIQIQRIKEL